MKKYYIIFCLLLATGVSSFAQTTGDYRSKASAAWTALTTWERWSGSAWVQPTAGQGYPGQLATPAIVTIVDNNDVSYATGLNLTIGSLVFQGGANETTLTIAGTGALTVNGAITMNGTTTTGGTHATVLSIGTGSVSCASLALVPVSGNYNSSNRRTEVTISTGSLTVSGDITCSGNIQAAGGGTGVTFTGAGTLNIGGSLMATNLGAFTESSSTVNFNGSAAAQTIDVTNYSYFNITTNNTNANGAVFGAAVTTANVTGAVNVASGLLKTNNLAFALNNNRALTVAAGATLDAGTTSLKFGTGSSDPTVNGTFITANTTAFTGATGAALSSTNTPTITLGSASTIEYNAAGTQPVTQRTDYANVTLTGASKTIAAGTVTLSGTLKVNSGATYNGATNNPTLTVKNIDNAGTFTSGSATVTLSAAAVQSLSATGTTNFAGLTINNTSGGVDFSGAASLSGALTLTSGILRIATGATLTISNGNAVGGTPFSATKHIATLVNTGTGAQGFVRANNLANGGAYLFPVGTGTYYLPVTVTPSDAAANNSFTVCAFNGITQNGQPNGSALLNKVNLVDAVWTVNYNGPGTPTASAATLTMGWPAALEGTSFSGLADALIGISHYATPAWGDFVGSGSQVNNTATRTTVTSFSPFAVGKLGPSAGTLPVKVYYFNASKGNSVNTLNWNAECSGSQVTFEIERSADGRNFTTINSITASQARCAYPFNYDDAAPLAGTNFYRIKIIDDYARVSYTTIAKVGSQQNDMKLVAVLPNPVSNTAQLNVTTAKKDNVELSVISLEGKVVYNKSVQLQSGSSYISLDVANLTSGTYFVRGVFGNGETSSIKFVKQ
ncbi:T9SS type A sorting domain-containing protein [Ferruginibacter sp.]